MMRRAQPKSAATREMPQPSVRRADLFSVVGILPSTSFLNGLPPHIAQVIAGHRDINVTLGYKAAYPDEAIQAHLAFLARRRALRPTEEYRAPTDAEWEEFLGHFERRKVATGICGRAVGTPCIHEHSCDAPCTGPTQPSGPASPRSATT